MCLLLGLRKKEKRSSVVDTEGKKELRRMEKCTLTYTQKAVSTVLVGRPSNVRQTHSVGCQASRL